MSEKQTTRKPPRRKPKRVWSVDTYWGTYDVVDKWGLGKHFRFQAKNSDDAESLRKLLNAYERKIRRLESK